MIATLLLAAVQVGPNPTPLELEPLPVHRREKVPAETEAAPAPVATAAGLAVAGNMAIIEGEYEKALTLLGQARSLAESEGKPRLAAETGLDRARALMMLGRNDEAGLALDQARAELPGDAQAWVVSSVNARRKGDLAKAQKLIEESIQFAPRDPGVGLEAGTIAYMVGDDEAALRSWQSVIDTAPASDEAEFARQYLESAGIVAAHGKEEPIGR